jgi:hypothetical protein
VPVDVYFANHSLHHIAELEHVYTQVRRTIAPTGVLLVNDMVGRNGHIRWPEALALLSRIWQVTPARYRRNRSTGQVDDVYPDLDCSTAGFEGVRAQDVLPLLLEHFHPDVFVAFANIIDPFIDRVYGFNFDATNPADCTFLDHVGALDNSTIDLGLVTPTDLIASFRPTPTNPRYPRDRNPRRMVREPASCDRSLEVVAQLGDGQR